MILEKYTGPIDLKYMTYEELEKLAEEVRDYILDVTQKTEGMWHRGSVWWN